MYKHFIITRFNLKKEGWETNKHNIPVLTPEWLEDRFTLFENFCFPSIQGQINQNFTWLVYFDISTPPQYKERIQGLSRNYKNFQPIYVNGMEEFIPSIQMEIKKTREEYIISSRVDNDDCVDRNYTEEIQTRFTKEKQLALDFVDGYILQIAPDYKLGKLRQLFNPFISLIEENNHPKSVWQKTHAEWKNDPLVKRIEDIRVWMAVIHEANKVNTFTGYGSVDGSVFQNFSINEEVKKKIILNLKPYREWLAVNLKNFVDIQTKCIWKDIKRGFRLRIKEEKGKPELP